MIGKVLNNRYEIIATLGSGGMANVYKARCRILNRIVTVKILKSELAEDRDFVRRFQLEAQAVASLSHPNIVSIYDVGQENGIPYLVMEYVEGSNLKEIIQKNGPLPPSEVINIGIQVCAALSHAHEKGIIHRDIKSHNILVTPAGRVKVTDFGLARVLSVPGATMTQSGTVMGSVHYFSPEQAQGEEVGTLSDIYSLGVVLYEAITGCVPFEGDNPITIALKHIQQEPPELYGENSSVPRGLREIILKAMAKDPRQRFSSAREMQRALSEGFLCDSLVSDQEHTKILKLNSDRNNNALKRKKKRYIRLALLVLTVLVFATGTVWAVSSLYWGEEVPVPQVTQMPLEKAQSKIYAAGFRLQVHEVFDSRVAAGLVVRQSPIAGVKVKKGRTIELWVSKGPRLVWLPDVRGYSLRDAKILLNNSDSSFQINVEEVYDDETLKDTVINQVPSGDRKVPEGSKVTLIVSKGPHQENLVMPSLLGLTVDRARSILEAMGLKLGEIKNETSYEYAEGLICGQDTSQGTPVQEGTAVNVTVSNGPGAQQKIIPLELKARDSGEVKIIVNDLKGSRVAYEGTHEAGDKIKRDIEVYAPGEILVYFQDQLVEKYPVQ